MLIGVIGKPSVGKSTFFRAATLATAEVAPYPFTTIKPNSAIGYVKIPDVAQEFEKEANPREGYVKDSWRFVPVQMIDVAGLVPGAHEGKGMGNQFLDDLRQADVFIHVIDISGSTNEKGETIPRGSYNPQKDIEFLETELDMWYSGILKKNWTKMARQAQQEQREIYGAIAKQLSGLNVNEETTKKVLNKLNFDLSKPSEWTDEQLKKLAKELRNLTKPMIIACNKIDVKGAKENYQKLIKENPNLTLIACSAESELALREADKKELIKYIPGEKNFKIINELNEKQKTALDYIKKNILPEGTGIQKTMNAAIFDKLKYKAIHPGGINNLEDKDGNVIPDCFLMPEKTTALDFAYKIHTDIGNKFVKAIDVRTKLPIGKNHVLKHLDIIEIKTT